MECLHHPFGCNCTDEEIRKNLEVWPKCPRHDMYGCCSKKEVEAAQKRDAALVLKYVDSEGYLIGTEIEYDTEGPVPSVCECGEVFQYLVETEYGPGHTCYLVECETAEAKHKAEYEGSHPYGDDFEEPEHFKPEY